MTETRLLASFNPDFESLTCFDCGAPHDLGRLHSVCERCGLPLQVNMRLKPDTDPASIIDPSIHSLWRYSAVLPVRVEAAITLTEGWTPLVQFDAQTWVKDEARNPTGSFKARRHVDGGFCGRRPRGPQTCRPVGGQRRRRPGRVRGRGSDRGAGGNARGHSTAVCPGVQAVRGTGGAGPGHHRRLRKMAGRASLAGRFRPLDPQGAIPRGG